MVAGQDFLTVREAAHRLRVSEKSVYRLIRRGLLPVIRPLNQGTRPHMRISVADLNTYIENAIDRNFDNVGATDQNTNDQNPNKANGANAETEATGRPTGALIPLRARRG